MSGFKGLYDKYKVIRAESGEEVDGAFILRPSTDTAARIALATYAEATHNPKLARDIRKWLKELRKGE
ncbi:hypothetical protein ACFL5X_01160 [Candidatus Omnitrophota bacterium]